MTQEFVNANIEIFKRVAKEFLMIKDDYDEIEINDIDKLSSRKLNTNTIQSFSFIQNMGGMRFVSYIDFTNDMLDRVQYYLRKKKLERILCM